MGRLVIAMLWGVLVYLLWMMFFRSHPTPRNGHTDREPIESMVQDPHCETFIPQSQALRKTIRGETHYFCGKDCLEAFRKKAKS